MSELRGVVTGMDCANCLAKVTKSIESITGIEDVNLNLVSTKLIVKYNENEVSEKDIINKIKKTGYGFNSDYERKSFFNISLNVISICK